MYKLPYFSGHPISISDMWPEVEIKDITDMVDARLFSPVPSGRHDFKHVGIMGDLGSGKTQSAVCLAKKAFDFYGEQNINIIYDRDVIKAIKKMDARPVQLLIIDDAAGAQNSRKSYENVDAVQDVLTVRHKAAMRQDGAAEEPGGIVFILWLWQFFMNLDRNFRTKLHYVFLKTYEIERSSDYNRFVGGYGDILRKNTERIEKGDQQAKSYAICSIPSMFQDGNRFSGRGVYQFRLVNDFPQFPDTRIVDKPPQVDPVGEFFKGVNAEKLFRAREIAYLLSRDVTQAEAAKQWDMSQPDVSKLLKWYRELGGVKDPEDA